MHQGGIKFSIRSRIDFKCKVSDHLLESLVSNCHALIIKLGLVN